MKRKAMIRASGGDPGSNDITNLSGRVAEEVGFGINTDGGLAYAVE